jgi:hypothetical protein
VRIVTPAPHGVERSYVRICLMRARLSRLLCIRSLPALVYSPSSPSDTQGAAHDPAAPVDGGRKGGAAQIGFIDDCVPPHGLAAGIYLTLNT